MGRQQSAVVTGRPSEAGFAMIEAVVAVGLVTLGVGSALAGVVAVERQTADNERGALTQSAQNILTDLRAATAYDAGELVELTGKSVEFDLAQPRSAGSPAPLHVTARISRAADGTTAAAVTVRDARGLQVTLGSALAQEVPAPGSVVPAQTPAPELP